MRVDLVDFAVAPSDFLELHARAVLLLVLAVFFSVAIFISSCRIYAMLVCAVLRDIYAIGA